MSEFDESVYNMDMVSFWETTLALKIIALGCALLAWVELLSSSRPCSKKPVFFTLVDIAYVVLSAGSCAAFGTEGYYFARLRTSWSAWTPEESLDIFLIAAVCAFIVFLSVVFVVGRLRGEGAPGIVCAAHGVILTLTAASFLDLLEYKYWKQLPIVDTTFCAYSEKTAVIKTCAVFLTFGNFITSGFAGVPTSSEKKVKPERCNDLDSCSPFSRVFLIVLLKFFKNAIIRSKVLLQNLPRLKRRLRCKLDSEKKSQDLITKAERLCNPYHFFWLVIRHGWKEQLWCNAVTLLYYSTMVLRVPLFHGLLGDDTGLSFNQSVLLLLSSCVAIWLLSSPYGYFAVWVQLRAQLLLQTAVFKKVTSLSAASAASTPAGRVCTLLISDAWTVSVAIGYLANTAACCVCLLITMAALGSEIGYAPACACLLWILVTVVACFSMEPLVDKCHKVLYKYRDERLRKFTDFLSLIRTIKMAAMEAVFKRSLLDLRMKEIDQAYRVNTMDSFVETIFSASSSVGMSWFTRFSFFYMQLRLRLRTTDADINVISEKKLFDGESYSPFIKILNSLKLIQMMIIAFGVAMLTSAKATFSPSILFSSIYALSLVDALTSTMPYVIKFKSPAFRSSKRLISYFTEEEYCTGENEQHGRSPQTAGGIVMEDCSFAWDRRDSEEPVPVLTDVSVRFGSGSLVGVVGRVGSGKSSLLSAISGDMRCLRGSLDTRGSVAFVPQVPRVLNMSIRDNIIFGRKFDQDFYRKVLTACQLAEDISRLPSGDLTEAGDKGEMLSGGQKQRVALARAVYTRSDIFLLDDPTSSQDSRVGLNIMQQVIGEAGVLSAKTRVLVTNNARLPLTVNQWVLMDKSTAMCFQHLTDLRRYPRSPIELFDDEDSSRGAQAANVPWKSGESLTEVGEALKVIKEEGITSEKGIFQLAVAYFRYSGVCSPLAFLCFAMSAALVVCQLLVFKAWASMMTPGNSDVRHSSGDIIQWLILVCIGDVIFRLIAGVLLARATRRRSLALHAVMLERLAASPLSFFDSSPQGRIFNRFSVDLEMNDNRVFLPYKQLFQNVFYVLGRLALIGMQAPVVFGLTCAVEVILVFAMRHVLRATTMGRAFESTRASLVLQHLTETLECAGLIRCYNVTQHFCARFRRLMTSYLGAYNVFALFLALGCLLITFCGELIIVLTTAIVAVPAHGTPTSASNVGLALVSSITVSFAMTAVFQAVFWTVQGDVAFKRALEYTDLPAEEEAGSTRKAVMQPSALGSPGMFVQSCENSWPSRGEVIFDHYSASYRPGITEDTLKDICFVARPGEKVAIVGRTGAGKSSVVLGLLRMIQCTSGTITIDGVAISTVPLKRLRTAVSVIPQDSSLFRGTLRENLDPEGSHSEIELKKAIGQVHLSDFVEGCTDGLGFAVSEKGGNLSAGQRQLVALARALLRKTKVLVLDEATSQMDPGTQRRVQATLRDSFAHCTLITIAHRIETIMDYDRVIVMGEGRVLESGRPTQLIADEGSTFRSMALSAGIDPDLNGKNSSSHL